MPTCRFLAQPEQDIDLPLDYLLPTKEARGPAVMGIHDRGTDLVARPQGPPELSQKLPADSSP